MDGGSEERMLPASFVVDSVGSVRVRGAPAAVVDPVDDGLEALSPPLAGMDRLGSSELLGAVEERGSPAVLDGVAGVLLAHILQDPQSDVLRVVNVIDAGHCQEVLDGRLDGWGPAYASVGPPDSPRAGIVFGVGHCSGGDTVPIDAQPVLQCADSIPGKVVALRESAGFYSFADCVVKGLNDGGRDSVKQVLDDVNCRGDLVFAGLKPLPLCFPQLGNEQMLGCDRVGFKARGVKDGRPAILMDDEEIMELSKPLQLSLIGKFPAGRPKWISVQQFFAYQKLKGEYKVANLDARHIIIHFQLVEDYIKVFSKQFQYINGFLIKFLKWTVDFNVNNEPSVCPVWISFPMLGLHLYTSSMLFSIASIFGRPLCLDYATRHRSRPNSARILVEVDVRIQHPYEVWIGSAQNGYIQKVCFENLPSYCLHCRKTGHCEDNCFFLHPGLRKEKMAKNLMSSRQDVNKDKCKVSEADNEVRCSGDPLLHDTLADPVGVEPISYGLVVSDPIHEVGESPVVGSQLSLPFPVGVSGGGAALQEDIWDGKISSLDNLVGQELIGVKKQVLPLDDGGKECVQRDDVGEGSMGSDLDVCPREDFMLHSLPKVDSFDCPIADCKTQNKASTSKRFTRSSLKKIDGQQLLLQWHGNEKKMDKVFNIIDRVLEDNVRLEELKRHRENAVLLKQEEKKKREEKKVAAAARLQDKLVSKKSQGRGKGKKK